VFYIEPRKTAIIDFYDINRLVFIPETECVYCVVGNKSLNIIPVNAAVHKFSTSEGATSKFQAPVASFTIRIHKY
jgi:hypothetical protein